MATPTLETTLAQLVTLTPRAQRRWYGQQRKDDAGYSDPYGEDTLWPALTYQPATRQWRCGWQVQSDEATIWAFDARGSTPLEAAHAAIAVITRRKA